MQVFSGIDYIKLDLADHFGLDKANFDKRLIWVESFFDEKEIKTKDTKQLLSIIRDVQEQTKLELENEPKALGALLAWQDYLNGRPSGYICNKDGSASGLQLMSALMKCPVGLNNTGLLGSTDGTNERKDIYTLTYNEYNRIAGKAHVKTRKEIKKCMMTWAYGSKAIPTRILGEEGLDYFYEACKVTAMGASHLRDLLLHCWNSEVTAHTWVNADGYVSHVPVMVENHYTLSVAGVDVPFVLKQQGKSDFGISNAANATHGTDAMVLRELVRRCNHNPARIAYIAHLLQQVSDGMDDMHKEAVCASERLKMGNLGTMIQLFEQTGFCSVRICEFITSITDVLQLSSKHRAKLKQILFSMVRHGSFEVCTIHDSFGCTPNKMNYVRYWYKEIIADIVESDLLNFMYKQIHPKHQPALTQVNPFAKGIADLVRLSDYGLA